MSGVIDMRDARLAAAVKKGFRNWSSQFKEDFDASTRLFQISIKTLAYLAQGKDKGAFYIYDLIMNLLDWGSGFEFYELSPKKKMAVMDQYLFLLDRIRFECMKKLGWLESYPGEEYPLVELVTQFDRLAPSLQAKIPVLSENHPDYETYATMNTYDKEGFIRKLIPNALKKMAAYSTTL